MLIEPLCGHFQKKDTRSRIPQFFHVAKTSTASMPQPCGSEVVRWRGRASEGEGAGAPKLVVFVETEIAFKVSENIQLTAGRNEPQEKSYVNARHMWSGDNNIITKATR